MSFSAAVTRASALSRPKPYLWLIQYPCPLFRQSESFAELVRQQEHIIDHATPMTVGPHAVAAAAQRLLPCDFALALAVDAETGELSPVATSAAAGAEASESSLGLQEFLDRAAADRIRAVLAEAGGVRVEAARRLGIDRTTLYRLMRKFDIDESQ